MEQLEDYNICTVCDARYITYEKYKDSDKICPRCRKKNPTTVINQNE